MEYIYIHLEYKNIPLIVLFLRQHKKDKDWRGILQVKVNKRLRSNVNGVHHHLCQKTEPQDTSTRPPEWWTDEAWHHQMHSGQNSSQFPPSCKILKSVGLRNAAAIY